MKMGKGEKPERLDIGSLSRHCLFPVERPLMDPTLERKIKRTSPPSSPIAKQN